MSSTCFKPKGFKHEEDIKKLKIKILIEKRCIWLVNILQLYYNAWCKKHKIVSNIACSNT